MGLDSTETGQQGAGGVRQYGDILSGRQALQLLFTEILMNSLVMEEWPIGIKGSESKHPTPAKTATNVLDKLKITNSSKTSCFCPAGGWKEE